MPEGRGKTSATAGKASSELVGVPIPAAGSNPRYTLDCEEPVNGFLPKDIDRLREQIRRRS